MRKLSLYVLCSWAVCPSNLVRVWKSGTCGMMLSFISSRNNGGGGRSTDKNRYGVSSSYSKQQNDYKKMQIFYKFLPLNSSVNNNFLFSSSL